MRFAISIPQLDAEGAGVDADGLRAYLRRAEELGFAEAWVLEGVAGEAPLLAPLELLAYAAAVTDRLRLGVAVLVTSLHDPLQLAAAVTTVDRLSHGRLDLGVAPGGRSRQFAAFGVDQASFIGYFLEGLELMKTAWSDAPRVRFSGRFRQVNDVVIQPKPIQRPHPPIWFGGHAPQALARAARHGDAFMGAGSATTTSFARSVSRLRHELDLRGRDASRFTIGKRVYVIVDDDAARARDRVITGVNRIYDGVDDPTLPDAEAVSISSTPADVARGLREVIDAGAQTILLNPVGATVTEDRDQMEHLAAEVIPQLT